jgi:hypothetical protein
MNWILMVTVCSVLTGERRQSQFRGGVLGQRARTQGAGGLFPVRRGLSEQHAVVPAVAALQTVGKPDVNCPATGSYPGPAPASLFPTQA